MSDEVMRIEEVNVHAFQAKVTEQLTTIGREMHDFRLEQRRQGELIAGWGEKCATRRGELERRVGNARIKLVFISVTTSVAVIGVISGILYYALR